MLCDVIVRPKRYEGQAQRNQATRLKLKGSALAPCITRRQSKESRFASKH